MGAGCVGCCGSVMLGSSELSSYGVGVEARGLIYDLFNVFLHGWFQGPHKWAINTASLAIFSGCQNGCGPGAGRGLNIASWGRV